ncbi:MAG TPA: hypothetical protein VHK05_04840 [Candidatus Limnocylindrales bacterium]|jgi:hypothetical protein|nr:hypothetical protein [Candidatus Limnocylindrales bacterium]
MTDDLADEMAVLRAASDQLVLAIAEVDARERRKRGMRPGQPAFLELARAVRIASEVVLELARREERTAIEIERESGGALLPPIERMTPAKELASILDEWRAVEHRLVAAEAGSPEAEQLMTEFERLRDAYGEALKARRKDPSSET